MVNGKECGIVGGKVGLKECGFEKSQKKCRCDGERKRQPCC